MTTCPRLLRFWDACRPPPGRQSIEKKRLPLDHGSRVAKCVWDSSGIKVSWISVLRSQHGPGVEQDVLGIRAAQERPHPLHGSFCRIQKLITTDEYPTGFITTYTCCWKQPSNTAAAPTTEMPRPLRTFIYCPYRWKTSSIAARSSVQPLLLTSKQQAIELVANS